MGFDEVYERYFKDVYRYLLGLSGDAHTAEELTQETFYKALRHIDVYDGEKDVRPWLFSITKNAYLTVMRKQRSKALSSELLQEAESKKARSDSYGR